jgi:hypothetical protein
LIPFKFNEEGERCTEDITMSDLGTAVTSRGILRKGGHMDSRYFIKIIFIFTPLECPAIYGGDDINKASIPYRKGVVKALSFLTGFTFLLAILSGSPARVWISTEPPVPLDPFLSSKWVIL